ncbi:hypothetical protein BDY19DRAFT_905612 [Irpex rosettiformis]|uniref:Uncharacterized protein n=1 Tax=Irpex rosettiformis TaxID=378272 RepID=A0ACB8U6Q1_9APHY|nr:hypothetical protein BDY19DRAFT_905612 [Irpex rosettiformis]
MRLRNAKDTVRPTLQETLADVHPLELDECFHFLVKDGSTVWIRPKDGKWRRGTVLYESIMKFDKTGVIRQWHVEYGKGSNRKTEIFQPLWGNMKPDTPEVHELLRRNGYFV